MIEIEGISIGSALQSGLDTLIQTVENVAPELWRITIRQQMAIGYAQLIGASICLLLFTIFLITTIRKWSDWKYEEIGTRMILGLIVLMIIFIPLLICGVMRLYNPEYYAIRALVYMATGNYI